MADKTPLKAIFTGEDVTALGEFGVGDTVPVASGGTGAATSAAALASLGGQPLDATLTAISDGSMGAFGHRNKIINGGFAINQRAYVSGAETTAGQYTLDRWKVTGTGGITFSTTANKTTVTIPSGQAFRQVIEGRSLQSGTYVLSWEGTAQGKIGAGSLGASGITGSITGGTDTTIEFAPGTVANVQIEFGSVPTAFEHRPYGTELALCQRYYQTTTIYARIAATAASQYIDSVAVWAPRLRATPTVSLAMNTEVNCTTPTVQVNNNGLTAFVAASVAAGDARYFSNAGGVTASAEL